MELAEKVALLLREGKERASENLIQQAADVISELLANAEEDHRDKLELVKERNEARRLCREARDLARDILWSYAIGRNGVATVGCGNKTYAEAVAEIKKDFPWFEAVT